MQPGLRNANTSICLCLYFVQTIKHYTTFITYSLSTFFSFLYSSCIITICPRMSLSHHWNRTQMPFFKKPSLSSNKKHFHSPLNEKETLLRLTVVLLSALSLSRHTAFLLPCLPPVPSQCPPHSWFATAFCILMLRENVKIQTMTLYFYKCCVMLLTKLPSKLSRSNFLVFPKSWFSLKANLHP